MCGTEISVFTIKCDMVQQQPVTLSLLVSVLRDDKRSLKI